MAIVDTESQELTNVRINSGLLELNERLAAKVAGHEWGEISLKFTLKDGRVATYKVVEETVGK